uniref:Uncharacterized protein n=1 Tax=Panagrolaimus superbus TaxID=310955 RepID=A0A914YBK9_9BILA
MSTTKSETIKSPPNVSEVGEFTEELSEVGDSESATAITVMRAFANFFSSKSDKRSLSSEQLTQRFKRKVIRQKKALGLVCMDLGLLFRILLFLASLGTLILAVSRYLTLSEQVSLISLLFILLKI